MIPALPQDGAPVSVIGALLNHQSAWDAYGPQMHQDPHKAPPKAPVLYLKPANTWQISKPGSFVRIEVPAQADGVQIGATLGVLIGEKASGLTPRNALGVVAGYTLVIDASLPQPSLYRPPLKYNARDGYCPMGPLIASPTEIGDIANLVLTTQINDQRVHETRLGELRRDVAQLLVDITEFMSLSVGDLVLLGVAHGAPLAVPGSMIQVSANSSALGILRAQVSGVVA